MHRSTERFESLNLNKANFDTIYTLRDPREYFRVLFGLDYVIPDLAKDIFRSAIGHCAASRGAPVKVLDVGCSFGINAALLRFPIDLQRLARRYAHPSMHALSAAEVVEMDGHYFQSWPEQLDATFVGLDSSEAAIAYAVRVGLLEAGITTNLERAPLPADEAALLDDVDLVISTGCVGYVTERTFRSVLAAQNGRMPWVVNFVLRMFSYDNIAAELARFGLVTEKLGSVTFVQRRFRSEEEFEATLAALEACGLDPAGKEAEGLLHAELYLSRPREEVDALSLESMVSVTSGANRRYGRRFRQVAAHNVKLLG